MKTTVILTVSDGSIRHILHGQRWEIHFLT